MKKWLYLKKMIHTSYSHPFMSSEEYIPFAEVFTGQEDLNNDEYLSNFKEIWGDYIDNEYTERGYHIEHEFVDIPRSEWIYERIETLQKQIISSKNELKKLNRLTKSKKYVKS